MYTNLICPDDNNLLTREINKISCSVCGKEYPIEEGVIKLLEEEDNFYEGAYLNRVKFNPEKERIYHLLPLWVINSGYLWNVRKYVPYGSVVVELGCGGGVNYFGKRYNMIGIDLSFSSLKQLNGTYKTLIQTGAGKKIPLVENSADAVISSYFWEHISPELKPHILKECRRILKPGGKIIFLYDIETKNPLINKLKMKDINLYNKLFLEGDGHVGYQTYEENKKIFEEGGFVSVKHLGLERTFFQSPSVYEKIKVLDGTAGFFSKLMSGINKSSFFYFYNLFLRIFDSTAGKIFPADHSRITISILKN